MLEANVDSITAILKDAAKIAPGLVPGPGILGNAVGVLAVHVEKIAKQIGYDIDGALPQLEDVALGESEPEPSDEQKRIADLEAQLKTASKTEEQARIEQLEAELASKGAVE